MGPMQWPVRAGVAVATLLVAASAGYFFVSGGGDSSCPTCPKAGAHPPVADVTAEGNSRITRIRDKMMAQKSLSLEDATFLHETATGGYLARAAAGDVGDAGIAGGGGQADLAVRRWAVAAMGDHLALGTEMDGGTREILEQTIIQGLSDPFWRIRSTSLACISRAKLTDRPAVRARIIEMRNDPNPQISGMAERMQLPEVGARSEGGQ